MIFLDMTPKQKQQKLDKQDCIKIKKASAAKETVKRQPTEQEEIFANHSSDKWLITRIYKEL